MDEQNLQKHVYAPYTYPLPRPVVTFPTGKGELLFGVWTLVFSLLLCNCLFFSPWGLGFGLAVLALLGGTAFYLRRRGHRFGWYETALLALCAFIAVGFLISDDVLSKLLMFLVLMAVPSLAFCIAAGQNRRSSAGFLSLLDGPRAVFMLGFGCLGEMGRGIREAFRSSGVLGRKAGAIGLGLLIAVPVLAMLVPLLMSADAAFEGLLDLLPELDIEEALTTVVSGFFLAVILYTRGVALHHKEKAAAPEKHRDGLSPLTVNTVLLAVAVVYLAYLASQLAYFVGGFSGILPEDFTLSEYARRGFFEMGWLCALNLGIIALAVGLVQKNPRTPGLTRFVCLFIGLITVFLVATASAKMFLYIRSYGLTRARVTTEVFMLWLVVTTVLVCVWLFREKLPYMKISMVLALSLCAVLFWADVDARVAQYNVRAYQSGKLETVDVGYLDSLSSSAVPYLHELTSDTDREVAARARLALESLAQYNRAEDYGLLDWNWTRQRALEILEEYRPPEAAQEETNG